MFLTKYKPINQVDSFWNAFDRDFFPVVRRFFEEEEEGLSVPKTNISEDDKEFTLTMELPGVSKKDVEISVDGDALTVEADRTEKFESKNLVRAEIRTEKFRRTFQIGSKIDREAIKAKLENGILMLTLPKKAETVGRKIDIA
ncbi:MAG: Hsp20/alpha crystallin family protein [Chitinivibrionia bacterium]|nr:Hsp20/alpha crystallin family protein [Chitinivibrionia bacterium]